MLNGQEVSNNKSVWDGEGGTKFKWSCENCSLLISKANGVSAISMKELKQRNNEWESMAKYLAPVYPNNHIWREKATQNQI